MKMSNIAFTSTLRMINGYTKEAVDGFRTLSEKTSERFAVDFPEGLPGGFFEARSELAADKEDHNFTIHWFPSNEIFEMGCSLKRAGQPTTIGVNINSKDSIINGAKFIIGSQGNSTTYRRR